MKRWLAVLGLTLIPWVAHAAYQLTWTDNSNNEIAFEIERKLGPDTSTSAWTLIATVGVNVTTYTDSAVVVGVNYCYRVRATNNSGASGYSNVACAATPVAPSSLTIQQV